MRTEIDQMDLSEFDCHVEFEQFLDDWYAQREAEWADLEIARLEMEDRKVRGEIDGSF